jgi:hypothetical protein
MNGLVITPPWHRANRPSLAASDTLSRSTVLIIEIVCRLHRTPGGRPPQGDVELHERLDLRWVERFRFVLDGCHAGDRQRHDCIDLLRRFRCGQAPPLDLDPTFRISLVVFTNIGRHKATCRAAQGGEASADVPL